MPAFKPPESRNAANTMGAMAVLLGVIFVGVSIVAVAYSIVPSVGGYPSVVSLVAAAVFGQGSALHVTFLVATMLILFLAANTSYNAFPRLAAILAKDGYMPRQFAFRGDRLAYSWGITLLAAVAVALIAIFGGTTTLLIPLYAVGVFVCFSISQLGMVRHWLRVRGAGWRWGLAVNGLGAVVTAIVLAIVVYEKFSGGAYLVVILIPLLVGMMLFIRHQYAASAKKLEVRSDLVFTAPRRRERAVVAVDGLDRAAVQAVNVARSVAEDVRAVTVTEDGEAARRLRDEWERRIPDVPLDIVETPSLRLVEPMVHYLDLLEEGQPTGLEAPITFVVLPEFVPRHWWDRPLFNQSAGRLRRALVGRLHTVVIDVPYRRGEATPVQSALPLRAVPPAST